MGIRLPRISLQPAPGGRRSRLAVVLGYALVGMLWIALSDRLVLATASVIHWSVLETFKGILYVGVTAAGLWLVMLLRDIRLERGRRDLAAKEDRYRMLAERAQDVVYRYRYQPTMGYEYISPSAATLTGYTPEELRASDIISQILLAEDCPKLLAWLESDSDQPLAVRWRHRDGRILWTEHRVTRLRDEVGRLVAIEGTARDVTARIEAEAHGRLLSQVIDASPIGVVVTDGPDDGFRVRYANTALATMMGRAVQNIIGQPSGALSGTENVDRIHAMSEQIGTGQPFEVDTSLQVEGGDPLPVSILVSPIRSADGRVESAIAIISDRSETIGRLRAESQLRAVLDASPLAVVATDLDGLVTSWNPAAERLFGWTCDEVLGHPLPTVEPATWAASERWRTELIAGEVDDHLVSPLRRRDDSLVTCAQNAGVIRDEAGRPTGIMSIIEDKTEQHRREEWNALLGRAIDQAAEAIVMTDLEGTITYVNPAFARVSGYGRDELIGANPRVLASGLTPRHVYADMWAKLRSGDVWRGTLVNRRKDGSLFEEEATLSPVTGASDTPIAYVGVKRDITLERRLAMGLSSELRDRAAVQEAMERIDVRDSPEATAQRVCEALAGFEEVDEALVLHLSPGHRPVVPLGISGGGRASPTLPMPLEPAASAYYRRRAQDGPWSHSYLDLAAGSPAAGPLLGVDWLEHRSYVAAPVQFRDRPLALVIAATDTDAPDAWIARNLRVVAELAAHAAPLIGPQLIERDAAVRHARRRRAGDAGGDDHRAGGTAGSGSVPGIAAGQTPDRPARGSAGPATWTGGDPSRARLDAQERATEPLAGALSARRIRRPPRTPARKGG